MLACMLLRVHANYYYYYYYIKLNSINNNDNYYYDEFTSIMTYPLNFLGLGFL